MNKIPFSNLAIVVVIFLGHTFKIINFYQELLLIFLIMLMAYLKENKLNSPFINAKDKMNFIFLFILLLSSLYSINQMNSLKYIYIYVLTTLITILVTNLNFKKKINLLDLFFVFSGMHTILTLIQFLESDVILTLNKLLLNDEDLQSNNNLLIIDSYAGITGQTAINAYFISIFIAGLFSKIMVSAKKNKFLIANIVMLSVSFFALIITNKRSFLIINIVCILFIWIIFTFKNRLKNNKKILIPIIILFIFLITKKFLPEDNNIIMKFKILSDSSDFSNGREYLWNETIKIFKENPYFGIGINAIDSKLDNLTHNIYIQLLAEMGIFGSLFFWSLILLNLLSVSKKIFKMIYKNENLFVNERVLEMNLFSIYMQILFIFYGFSGNPFYSINFLLVYFISVSITHTAQKKTIKDDLNEKSRNINIS